MYHNQAGFVLTGLAVAPKQQKTFYLGWLCLSPAGISEFVNAIALITKERKKWIKLMDVIDNTIC